MESADQHFARADEFAEAIASLKSHPSPDTGHDEKWAGKFSMWERYHRERGSFLKLFLANAQTQTYDRSALNGKQ